MLYYDFDSGFPSYDSVIVLVDSEPLKRKYGVPGVHVRPSPPAAAATGSAGKQQQGV
jgi:hypothetical protein